jgi:HPt (histidine-containing phosphotransfer) domain-containing protein
MARELKHINTVLLLEVFGNDQEIICDMIDVFITMAKEYYIEINSSYEAKNWFELGLVSHKAKASFRTMGLSELGDSLDNIENNSKGIAYNELDESRNLSPDKEKLYKCMLREGQQKGDTAIIDKRMKFIVANFNDAIEEILYFKTNMSKHI